MLLAAAENQGYIVFLAIIAFLGAPTALLINRVFDSRKDRRTAEEMTKQKELDARLAAQKLTEQQDREDLVARRAATVARETAERQEAAAAASVAAADAARAQATEAARLLVESDRRAAERADILSLQVGVVHGLVNNEKTEGYKTQLVLHKVNLRLLRKDPDSTPEEIAVSESAIAELERTIAVRIEEDKIAQAKMGIVAQHEEALAVLVEEANKETPL